MKLIRSHASALLLGACSILATAPAHALNVRTLLVAGQFQPDDLYGSAVAGAGDVNGDGYADLIVGAPSNDERAPDGGRAYVYFGGPNADAIPDWTLNGLFSERFGSAVAGVGDVNHDGYDDVIVGAPQCPAGGAESGHTYVFYGGPTPDAQPDLFMAGEGPGAHFGFSVAAAGDVNGDGFDDIVVGSPDAGPTGAGRAYLLLGGTRDPLDYLPLDGVAAGDRFGHAVASAGDLNGDGYADFAIGAPGDDARALDAGRVLVYFGGAVPDGSADRVLTGIAAGDAFGGAVAPVHDVNGDGYDDLFVGAALADASGGPDVGRVYLFHGGPDADATYDLRISGKLPGDQFGGAVAGPGDVDGDGFADLVVGASGYDNAATNDGRVYVYFGGPDIDTAVDIKFSGSSAGQGLGLAVAATGDVDGDGYPDLIAGVQVGGRAFVYSPYTYHVTAPLPGTRWTCGDSAYVKWSGPDPADVQYSTDGGATWFTLATTVGGQANNILGFVVPPVPTTSAKVRVVYAGQTASHATSNETRQPIRVVERERPPGAAGHHAFTVVGTTRGLTDGMSSAGDIDGDGHVDIAVTSHHTDESGRRMISVRVLRGGPAIDTLSFWTITTNPNGGPYAGYGTVASAGDMNGDGYDDLVVGDAGYAATGTMFGRADVYFGGPTRDDLPDHTYVGSVDYDRLGDVLARAGDINGDGYDDLLIGAPNGRGARGYVHVHLGGPQSTKRPDFVITQPYGHTWFGYSLAAAGDVNRDGYDDFIIGSLNGATYGQAFLYLGGAQPDAVPDLVLTGSVTDMQFGRSVDGAGDFNGDGYDDVIVGSHWSHHPGGAAYVYFGGPEMDASPDWMVDGADTLGVSFSVAAAGDVNADGFADVIVAGYTGAYLFFGGPGADREPDWVVRGDPANQWIGFDVWGIGDNDGNGFDDVMVGVRDRVELTFAYVYRFDRFVVTEPNGRELWRNGESQPIAWQGSDLADVWLSLDDGTSYQPLAGAVGGAPSNRITVTVPAVSTERARVRVTPTNLHLAGLDDSDAPFLIQSHYAMLSLDVVPSTAGAELMWRTDPALGPGGPVGYRLYRSSPGRPGEEIRMGPDPILATRYVDAGAVAGSVYRLTALTAFDHEIELGRVTLDARLDPFRVWPTPLKGGEPLNIVYAGSEREITAADLEIGLYDLSGRRVLNVAHGPLTTREGAAVFTWSGRDARGGVLPAGLYFLRARSVSTGLDVTRRVVLAP